MVKIMLVEDDSNLREIYAARLGADGFEVVSAEDGEAGLALAVREKPDLIITDVMMPKISGFDMLDILRSTPETKDTKVIVMTALNQAEDKERGEKMGADKYLVKSQVTLDDVVRSAHEVLAKATVPTAESAPAVATPQVATAPAQPQPVQVAPSAIATPAVAPAPPSGAGQIPTITPQIQTPPNNPSNQPPLAG